MITLTEIIFVGKTTEVVLSDLLEMLIPNFENFRFNHPQDSNTNSMEEILKVFRFNDYVDLAGKVNKLTFNEVDIPDLFINITQDKQQIELLMFFDLKDLGVNRYKNSVDILRVSSMKFLSLYQFSTFRCQIDNGADDEYYFDENDLGPLYKNLIDSL